MEKTVNPFAPMPIAGPLVRWYTGCARDLPWRHTRDPYRIWVSEIMLQQTRVEAVKPYYARFISALPDAAALAAAAEEQLFKLWEGLGYYSRARNLQRAARMVMEQHNGALPADYIALLRLPGIGPYTAGAIASIAFDIPVPAVDGNVLRVLSRLNASGIDIASPLARRAAQDTLKDVMQGASPSLFNQAMMELGACVCLPNARPLCAGCPVEAFCAARKSGKERDFPIKTKKPPRKVEARTVFVLQGDGSVLVRKRPDTGLLASLYELPNVDGHLNQEAFLQQLRRWGFSSAGEIACYARKHIFTHVEWHMRVYALPIAMDATLPRGFSWLLPEAHALPAAFRICLPD